MIYLDYAATTPMSDHALSIYMKAAKNAFGNSSSLHDIGGLAARTLQASRKQITDIIGGNEKGLYFTSGGSEANILAIQSLLLGIKNEKKHIITTQFEHSSLYTFFQKLSKEGYDITYLKPDANGHISLNKLKGSLRSDTVLVSIQHGNSEVGSIQLIEDLGPYLREQGVLFHSDCVQTFGKLPIDVEKFQIDSISIASHKIYGPKGIGATYINPAVYWRPVIEGTTHESGFRPGTVDVPAAAAFATAAKELSAQIQEQTDHILMLRRLFIDLLLPYQDTITLLNKNFNHTLPNILPLIINGVEGQYMMLECNRFGFAISTGSACQVGMQAPSRSLLALGFDEQQAKQYIRISLGKQTTPEQIKSFTQVLIKAVDTFNGRLFSQ